MAVVFLSSGRAGQRVRTKICGIASVADAHAAVAAGADAIGLAFAHNSPRRLEIAAAAEISVSIAPFVSRVGLFMDDGASMVEDVIGQVPIDVLQFHGDETPEFCRGFGKPYIKTVAMGDADASVAAAVARYPDATALLLDGNRRGQPGGRGTAFDWDIDPGDMAMPLMVAGGLNTDNVRDAIAALRPYAVDVSSGVELAPGVKSADKMQAFVNAVLEAGNT